MGFIKDLASKMRFKKIKFQIEKYPDYSVGNMYSIQKAYLKKQIDDAQRAELILLQFKSEKMKKITKPNAALLIVDMYDTYDSPYRPNLPAVEFDTSAGSGNRLGVLYRISKSMAAAKKNNVPIFITTSQHISGNRKETYSLSEIFNHYLTKENLVVKPCDNNNKILEDAFLVLEFKNKIKSTNVDAVIIMGNRFENCVLSTIKGALRNEYWVIVCMDTMITPFLSKQEGQCEEVKLWLKKQKKVIFFETYKQLEEFIELNNN